MYCWILRTSEAPSPAACSRDRRWSWASLPAPRRRRSERSNSAWPRTAVSRLLKSWAMPIDMRPSISMRRRRVCSAAQLAGSRITSPWIDTGYRPDSMVGRRIGWKWSNTGRGPSPVDRSIRNTSLVTDPPREASTACSCANRASSRGRRPHSPSSPKTSRHASLQSSRSPDGSASAVSSSGATKGREGAGSIPEGRTGDAGCGTEDRSGAADPLGPPRRRDGASLAPRLHSSQGAHGVESSFRSQP